ncbi:hypothetical protein AMTR_s00001p00272820 [Amborella trichopoda]|uniref:Uncharacterized protein n=1 Tax=Amborella trichopoda TaxID=13333 RepID=W1NN05_AMBTC|nr:hypothetical protein AMTR_s00001p00272820 [Amborella trichopoda]
MEGMVDGIVRIVVGNKGRDGKGRRLVGIFGVVMAKKGGMVVGILAIVLRFKGIVVGIVGVVEVKGGNGGKVRARGCGVSNRWCAPRQAWLLSNDRTTSLTRRKLLLDAMARERRENMLEERENKRDRGLRRSYARYNLLD